MHPFLLGLIAGVVSFMIGGLWYGLFFRQAWLNAVGLDIEAVQAAGGGKTEMPFTFAIEVLVSIIMVYLLKYLGTPPIQTALVIGLISSLAAAKNYIFEQKNIKLYLISESYKLLCALICGLVLAWFG